MQINFKVILIETNSNLNNLKQKKILYYKTFCNLYCKQDVKVMTILQSSCKS